jgi:hypothetical protein
MRINELLEGRHFDDEPFVKHTADSREIDYDLADDLVHFMHNDDDVYRRHLYPAITQVMDLLKSNKPTHMSMFKEPVEKTYQIYIRKYPIKELPTKLDNKMCEEICKKMHEDIIKDIKDGTYGD